MFNQNLVLIMYCYLERMFKYIVLAVLAIAWLGVTGCMYWNKPSVVIEPSKFKVASNVFYQRTLNNGLQAIAVQDGKNSVSVFVVVGAGKRHETKATTGLAHLVEHAMYTGTSKIAAGEHESIVRAMGGQSNAFTREDYTFYYDHEIPINKLSIILKMEADRLRNLSFDESFILAERNRLLIEEQQTWSSSEKTAELIDQAVFTKHPYAFGVLSAAGHTKAIGLSSSDIKNFYNNYYHPDQVVVMVAGDIDPVQALDKIELAWSKLKHGPERIAITPEPNIIQNRDLEIKWHLSGERLEWVWLVPERAHSDRMPLNLLADIIARTNTNSGAVVEAVVGSRQDKDLFRIGIAGANNSDEIMAAIYQITDFMVDESILASLKARYLKTFISKKLRHRPYFSMAAKVAIYQQAGQIQQLINYERDLAAITPESLQEVARRYLDPNKRVSIHFSGISRTAKLALPDDVIALHRKAEDAAQTGNLQLAIAAYNKLLLMPLNKMNKVIYISSRGQIKMLQRDYKGAAIDFSAALKIIEYPALRNLLEEAREFMNATVIN